MARVTVEDCIQIINNRYELVLLAAQRARDIAAGAQLTVTRDNDKNPVISLREIAEQSISLEDLRYNIARGVNRHSDMNLEDDVLQTMVDEGVPALDINALEEGDLGGALDQIQELEFQSDEAPATQAAPEVETTAEAESEETATTSSEESAEIQASTAA